MRTLLGISPFIGIPLSRQVFPKVGLAGFFILFLSGVYLVSGIRYHVFHLLTN